REYSELCMRRLGGKGDMGAVGNGERRANTCHPDRAPKARVEGSVLCRAPWSADPSTAALRSFARDDNPPLPLRVRAGWDSPDPAHHPPRPVLDLEHRRVPDGQPEVPPVTGERFGLRMEDATGSVDGVNRDHGAEVADL